MGKLSRTLTEDYQPKTIKRSLSNAFILKTLKRTHLNAVHANHFKKIKPHALVGQGLIGICGDGTCATLRG